MPENKGYSGFAIEDKTGEKYEEELGQQLCKLFEQLSGSRGTWEAHWDEIARFMIPTHAGTFMSQQALQTKGDKRNRDILDSTAVIALSRFAAIVYSLLTPRNQFWHNLKPSDRALLRDKNTVDWFEKVNNILFEYRYSPKANFDSQNLSSFLSLGGYGTTGLFIDSLAGEKGFRYKNTHLGEMYIQENHQGVVDRVFRHFPMTARQAKQKFGDKCPEAIEKSIKNNPECEHFFLHVVLPRTDRDPQRKDFKGMPFASYYVARDGQKIVSEGGYRTFPYAISRYMQAPGETYGRSPAMDCLPAAKTLNKQKELLLKQGQLASDPVILVHDDGIMDGASVESGTYISGAITADGKQLVGTLPTGRVDINLDMMNVERTSINDSLLVTLFQILVETPEMTATEVAERVREKAILLAPTIGRQQSEYLGPMIEREIDILSSQGLLPPMPRMLKEAEGEYKIVYDSPITKTQKAEWAAGAMRSLETALNISNVMQDPSYLFYYNFDKIIPELSEINGTPSSWLNSKEVVDQMKAAQARQQQVQQQIEAAPAAAGMLKAMK